jgi:hypothetical protein
MPCTLCASCDVPVHRPPKKAAFGVRLLMSPRMLSGSFPQSQVIFHSYSLSAVGPTRRTSTCEISHAKHGPFMNLLLHLRTYACISYTPASGRVNGLTGVYACSTCTKAHQNYVTRTRNAQQKLTGPTPGSASSARRTVSALALKGMLTVRVCNSVLNSLYPCHECKHIHERKKQYACIVPASSGTT